MERESSHEQEKVRHNYKLTHPVKCLLGSASPATFLERACRAEDAWQQVEQVLREKQQCEAVRRSRHQTRHDVDLGQCLERNNQYMRERERRGDVHQRRTQQKRRRSRDENVLKGKCVRSTLSAMKHPTHGGANHQQPRPPK